jgi:hypothetical protein
MPEGILWSERLRSGGETRTLNHTVNSRVLCQLSYPGKLPHRRQAAPAGSDHPIPAE